MPARFPRQLIDHFIAKFPYEELTQNVTTSKDARSRTNLLQKRARAFIGPDLERTALNPQITATLDRGIYKVDNVLFSSRPGLVVSSNLYYPSSGGPFPAALFCCGHDTAYGKAGDDYSPFAQALARLGYICLIFDCVGVGERWQYTSSSAVNDHNVLGHQQILVGETQLFTQYWDATRALDYLTSRSEWNQTFLGVAGNSGGGTQTAMLAGLDSRPTCFAISNMLWNTRRYVDNELGYDPEQQFDASMFIGCAAPKPVALLCKEADSIDMRGVLDCFASIYKLWWNRTAFKKNLALVRGLGLHQIDVTARRAIYTFFAAHGGLGADPTTCQAWLDLEMAYTRDDTAPVPGAAPVAEPAVVLESTGVVGGVTTRPNLLCTSTNQVADAPTSSLKIWDFTSSKADALVSVRGTPTGETLLSRIRTVLLIPSTSRPAPNYRIWPAQTALGFSLSNYPKTTTPFTQASESVCVYPIQTDSDTWVPVYFVYRQPTTNDPGTHQSRPPRLLGPKALLYVAQDSVYLELKCVQPGADPTSESLINTLLAADSTLQLFGMDVRSAGECAPSINATIPSELLTDIANQIGEQGLIGRAVWDVIRACDFLVDNGFNQIHLFGRWHSATIAAMAAALHPNVTKVTLKNKLSSFNAVAKQPLYSTAPRTHPFNVLSYFDLPDVYSYLQATKTSYDAPDPWGARGSLGD